MGASRLLLTTNTIDNYMANLAIFDLDNTLLAGDSDYAWGNFLVDKGVVDPDVYRQENDRFYQEYQQKTLDIHEYQRFVLTPLIPMPAAQRQQLHNEFMATAIAPLRQAKADALIEKHKTQGDTLLVITATNRFIAGPVVEWLGISNLLATEPEEINEQFTGNIVGHPCFQEGKIHRLNQWLETQPAFTHTCFYSDSINDAPLMQHVDHAVAVDPDDRLRELAQQQQWPIISLRED